MRRIVDRLNELVPGQGFTEDLTKNLTRLAVLQNRVEIATSYLENWNYVLGLDEVARACFEILELCQHDRINLGKYPDIDFERQEEDDDRVTWTLWGKSALVKISKYYDEAPEANYVLLADFDGYAALTDEEVFNWLCEVFQ